MTGQMVRLSDAGQMTPAQQKKNGIAAGISLVGYLHVNGLTNLRTFRKQIL